MNVVNVTVQGDETSEQCVEKLGLLADELLVADTTELTQEDVEGIAEVLTGFHLRLIANTLDNGVESDDEDVQAIRESMLSEVLDVLQPEQIRALQEAYSELANLAYKIVERNIKVIEKTVKKQDPNRPKADNEFANQIFDEHLERTNANIDADTEEAVQVARAFVPVSARKKLRGKYDQIVDPKKKRSRIADWIKRDVFSRTQPLADALEDETRTIVDEVIGYQAAA